MALRAVVDADGFGELDEGTKGFYVASQDGSYSLGVADIKDHPAVRGLASTLAKYKEVAPSAHGLKDKLARAEAWAALGDRDPEEVTAALNELDELRAGGGNGKGGDELKTVYENRMAALATKHATELAARDSFIEKILVDNKLDEQLEKVAETGVILGTKKAVRAMLKEEYKFKVIPEGNDYRAVVETDMGEQDVDTFVDSWGRSDDAKAFLPASGNKGSGAGGGGSAGAGGRDNPWVTGNLTEQGRITKENPSLAKTLATAAGKPPPNMAA